MNKKRPIFWICTLFILSLAGLNWFTFTKASQYYLELNATRLDPLGLNNYPTTPPLPSLTTPRFVFFGDSRAAQWPAPDLPGIEFINRGIGAQTSTQAAGRFAEHVVPLQPDIVLVQVGINDLKTIPLFPRRRDAIVAACKTNIGRIVTQAQEMGATVILTTIFPTQPPSLERSFYWSTEADAAILEVNEYIHSLQTDNVIILDSHTLLVGIDGYTLSAYAADFLHLKPAGYAQLNTMLQPLLAEKLNEIRD